MIQNTGIQLISQVLLKCQKGEHYSHLYYVHVYT